MFTVQYTNSAFLFSSDVPEGQWRDYSTHREYSNARKTVKTLVRDMRERCGTGWDSNYRIVSDEDVVMTTTFLCDGYIGLNGHEACVHWAERVIRWTWEAGPEPPHPSANGHNGWEYIPIQIIQQTGPEGNWGLSLCPDCLAKEHTADDAIYEPDILTIQDIAREFNISTRRARALAKNRHERFGIGQQLPGGQWVFRPEDLNVLAPDIKHRRKQK